MKFAVCAIMLLMATSIDTHAQVKKKPHERAEAYSVRLKTLLVLTDPQYVRIKALNLERAKRNDEAFKQFSSDKKNREKQLKQIRIEWEYMLEQIVTPEQLAIYKQKREEVEASMQDKKKKKKADPPYGDDFDNIEE
jgi:hypothetical protein